MKSLLTKNLLMKSLLILLLVLANTAFAADPLPSWCFYYADEDGFMEGQISNKDKINLIYRHSSSTDTVVAVGTWTRKK